MRILLTNDDGILAPGLAALYAALTKIGEVSVVAPDSVQSAAGHGITVRHPVAARWIHVHDSFHGWAVAGRPADCVKLAVARLLDHRPDLVVSGINDGANVAVNVLYSGTVAAAAEGAILGIPSVAVSLEWGEELDFHGAAEIARGIIARFADRVQAGDPPCPLLNINIPDLTHKRLLGIRVVPQAAARTNDRYELHENESGSVAYSLSGWFEEFGTGEFDLGALREGNIVLTPLHFDMTDHARLERVRQTLADGA
ncbi:MAG TPA: 5'/3'-nucleotidase SurE [Phycisphaerae bacterium]|nr:5'/3'-nucleotidase SurE [Phycisphaerales bacterium]HRX86730.1 5'/3'-nucleotidase SurE [Phycisphaerae bacterium]